MHTYFLTAVELSNNNFKKIQTAYQNNLYATMNFYFYFFNEFQCSCILSHVLRTELMLKTEFRSFSIAMCTVHLTEKMKFNY